MTRKVTKGLVLGILLCMGCASNPVRPPVTAVKPEAKRVPYLTLGASPLVIINPTSKSYVTFTAKILGNPQWCVTSVRWYWEDMQKTPSSYEVDCMERVFQNTWVYHTVGTKRACFEVWSGEALAGRACIEVRIGAERAE